MRAENVIELYTLLEQQGAPIWVDGGWGIDALLERQTRQHKDLDALVRLEHLATLTSVLAARSFGVKELWSENRWVGYPGDVELVGRAGAGGCEAATAFVLRAAGGDELDIHVLTIDSAGNGVPAWSAELVYPPQALAARGAILGRPVRCLSAQMQLLTHTGYELQAKDRQDLRLLREHFG